MNLPDHLEWSRKRALELLEDGKTNEAFRSMVSDVMKHPELAAAAKSTIILGMQLLRSGKLATNSSMRAFIHEFD